MVWFLSFVPGSLKTLCSGILPNISDLLSFLTSWKLQTKPILCQFSLVTFEFIHVSVQSTDFNHFNVKFNKRLWPYFFLAVASSWVHDGLQHRALLRSAPPGKPMCSKTIQRICGLNARNKSYIAEEIVLTFHYRMFPISSCQFLRTYAGFSNVANCVTMAIYLPNKSSQLWYYSYQGVVVVS